jgi:hypothetical protein
MGWGITDFFSDCFAGIEESFNRCFEAMERDIEKTLSHISYESDNCFRAIEDDYNACIRDIEANYTRIHKDIWAAWKPVKDGIVIKINNLITERKNKKEKSEIDKLNEKIKKLEERLSTGENDGKSKVIKLDARKKTAISKVKDKFGGKATVLADMRKQKNLKVVKAWKPPSSW